MRKLMEATIEKAKIENEHASAFARNPLRPLIEKMATRIAEDYQPEQIILYGSQATGKARSNSDIDFLVIKQTSESYITRCASVKGIVRDLRGKTPVSPIVLTPREVQKRLDRGDRFIQLIFERGIELYHDQSHAPSFLVSGSATFSRKSSRRGTNLDHTRAFRLGGLNMATKKEDSLYPPDWLRVAERDWQRVEKRLSEGDQEDAGFRLQQALEKYLKAFLLANNWELEKTHEITTLLEEATKFKPELSSFIDLCERIENYYFTERYPSTLDAGILFEEVERDFKGARQLREMILETFIQKSDVTATEQNGVDIQERQPPQGNQDKNASSLP